MDKKDLLGISHFSDYFKLGQLVFDLKSTDKVQAVEELIEVLAKQKLIRNKKMILTRLIDRENLESTALGDGIAVPHARVDSDGEISIAVGRSSDGIDFSAPDKKKIHLIIVIIWNPTAAGIVQPLIRRPGPFPPRPAFPPPDF